MEIYINQIILASIGAVGLIATTKIVLNSLSFSHIINKKRMNLQGQYTKELEYEIDELQSKIKSMTAANNRKERGPQLEEGDLSQMIPALVGDLSQFLPKKLQPLFQDKELQSGLIKMVLDNPERFKPLISKFVKSKTGEKDNVSVEGMSV